MGEEHYGFEDTAFDRCRLPDVDREFITDADIQAFSDALTAPEISPFVSLNDWKPLHQQVKRKNGQAKSRKQRSSPRSVDETREGYVYALSKWPLLVIVLFWILILGAGYWITRIYVWAYEKSIAWRGRREALRKALQRTNDYQSWKTAANNLDSYLGNDAWKEADQYAYYDSKTVFKARQELKIGREQAIREHGDEKASRSTARKLSAVIESCTKSNFSGIESPRLYSETYYGTKSLAQSFIDEIQASLAYLFHDSALTKSEKVTLAQQLHANLGRTALCLSGGASFAWYHFGVIKALLDASLLPDVITGTSGGALVAALVATRTNAELQTLLTPALAHRINACEESLAVWLPRFWRSGARFDSVKWARQCSWFTRGNMTFREAYERTGRTLSITCIPSDAHSPSILLNYAVSPSVCIFSCVLASAAVPGILNPIPIMMKKSDGTLTPYSFGHKWKDGSLRTDIPLKALNLHFGVTFSIVSQVNPHINSFFYSSKGAVGRPVTHRRGRGWRGGYLGSAIETYLKLELQKFLKMLRHLELLPRPFGQDWSNIWLQQFSGTITIWPKSRLSDFWYILSDPTPMRLARMILVGQHSTWPKLLFIANRLKIERLVEEALLLDIDDQKSDRGMLRRQAPTSMYLRGQPPHSSVNSHEADENGREPAIKEGPVLSVNLLQQIKRQSAVFFDDTDPDVETEESDYESAVGNSADETFVDPL